MKIQPQTSYILHALSPHATQGAWNPHDKRTCGVFREFSRDPSDHIYIHIPFCHRVCPYCAFYKHTPGSTNLRAFVRAVVTEAKQRLPKGCAPLTLYFGGGTPSMLSPTHLQLLTDGLQEQIDLSRLREWSLEANPATFTAAKVRQWRELGISRVSLGAQSFDPHLLRILGREHSPEDIAESVHMLREEGNMRVNIDLMFCLPGQSVPQWQCTLEAALALQPDHISTYSLTLEPDTPFAHRFSPTREEDDVAFYSLSHDLLTAAGYRHYEVSNYARTDEDRSLHNLSCWRGESYVGLGPSACGTLDNTRYTNIRDTGKYIDALAQGNLPEESRELLTPEMKRTERIALGLRTDEGIPLSLLREGDKTILLPALLRENLATTTPDGGCLKLTPAGFLLADEIALRLM